jgi:hypothetical protein
VSPGDIQIINMHTEGDGEQVLELFMRQSEKVLSELMADMRLAESQHFALQEYKDPHDNKHFAGHSNGSVSFQLAQIQVGEGKVPVSIVLYIDSTYLKKGIPIRPVYRKCINIIPNIMHDVMSISIRYNISLDWAVGCLNNDRLVISESYAWRLLALLPFLKEAQKRTRIGLCTGVLSCTIYPS